MRGENILMKQVKNDIKQGFAEEFIKYLLVLFTSGFLIIAFAYDICALIDAGNINADSFTFADIILYLFKGIKPFKLNANIKFELPVSYVLFNILLAFIIGDYPLKDLFGVGKNILIRCRNRSIWWFSKCIWCVAAVLLFYGIIYLMAFFITMLCGEISFVPTEIICKKKIGIDLLQGEKEVFVRELIISAVVLPVVTSMALSVLQLFLSILFSPVIGYIFVVAILVGSAFYNNQICIGNYFMVIRSDIIIEGGYNAIIGIILNLCIILFSMAVGYIIFRRKDIIKPNYV